MDKLRIDKWLWAARFYKTRSLACDEIDKGRVEVNGQAAKPAREVKPGDTALSLAQGRPTKRDRRDLDQARHGWDARWSASLDP